jgi:hypothetical protein
LHAVGAAGKGQTVVVGLDAEIGALIYLFVRKMGGARSSAVG